MPPHSPVRTAFVWFFILLLVLLAGGLIAIPLVGPRVIGHEITSAASARRLEVRWGAIVVSYPAQVSITRLTVIDPARGDTVMRGDSLLAALDLYSLLRLRPALKRVQFAHARIAFPHAEAAAIDTLAPDEAENAAHPDHSDRLRRAAETLVETFLLPARHMPHLDLRDVTLAGGSDESAMSAGIEWLELEPGPDGVRLTGAGRVGLEGDVPFELALHYGNDDQLRGEATFGVPDANSGRLEPLRIGITGVVTQDRGAGVLRIGDSTRVTIGTIPVLVSGALERRGPSIRVQIGCTGVTQEQFFESVPRPLLGPLAGIAAQGSWDYRLGFRLDLSQPDSVDFDADVVSHGLFIDPAHTKLDVLQLDEPFVATIHLPHGRFAVRDLSPANPHYRPLEAIDSLLVYAVITNEDGGFFEHHGFNTEAVKHAIAENIRAGAFRRGAGTITMQLARNLFLGHERTLSRKAQEVIFAWVLEHLTYLTKQRLLEIYLNIIEWGPDVHGADEAARYYFGTGASKLSVDQALFLTTVVPAPRQWRYRFDEAGALRPFERAQMHFIGRAMVAKGWLAAEELPAADSLRVEITGAAREELVPEREPGLETEARTGAAEPARADSAGADTSATRPGVGAVPSQGAAPDSSGAH
jgi:hypothetical protein